MAQEQEKNSPNQGQINIKLPEKGLFFLNKKARYKVAVGGRGSAKSVTMGICSLIKAMESKKRILCTRQYQTNIKDSIHKLLSDYIYSLGFAPFFEITKDSIRCYNGSEYIFSGVQNNIAGIKSMEGIDICICEEAQTMSNESWEILIPTIRKEGSEFWIAFNPESEDDPTYQRFVKNPPENCLTVQMNYTDNPFFPEVLRQEMEYCKRVDYFKYQHIWEGQPTSQTEALVFKGKFVVQDFEIPSRYDVDRFFIGVDWGFSKDPTTMVLSFIKDNCLYICREGYGIGVDLAQIPQKIFSCVPEAAQGWPIYCDNARPETISFLKARRWRVMVDGKPTEVSYNLKPADKWKGSVEDGVDRLKSFEKIIIHPSCKHTIEEFSHYCYETDKRTGEILPKLVDTYNHCLVGNTLITTNAGKKKIKDVKAGDMVLTRAGYKKVLWAGLSDENRQVYKLETQSGKKVIGTNNHKIFTSRGFVRIDELRAGDMILTERSIELCKAKKLQPMGKNGIDTRIPSAGATEFISNALTHICMFLFGKNTTDQEKRGMSYTTKTETHKTTISPTLSRLPQKNTWQIGINGVRKEKSKPENGLSAFQKKRPSGTAVKRAYFGIRSRLENIILGILNMARKSVYVAARNIRQEKKTKNFAPIIARADGAEKTDWILSPKNAFFVEKNIKHKNIRKQDFVADYVRCVRPIGIARKVYDLTVDGKHEFFANGILVHNCIDGIRYSLNGYITRKGADWLRAYMRDVY